MFYEEYKLIPYLRGMSYASDSAETITFYNGENHYNFSGNSVVDIKKILNHLNGLNSITQIADLTNLEEEYVYEILMVLISKNVINFNNLFKKMNINDFETKLIENYLDNKNSYKSNSVESIKQFYSKKIYLTGNEFLVNIVREKISSKLNLVDEISNDPDLIVVVDFYENKNLFKKISSYSHINNIPFLKVVLTESKLLLGPIFIPNETTCYDCYLSRLFTNLENPMFEWKLKENFYEEFSINNLSMLPGSFTQFVGTLEVFLFKFFLNNISCELIEQEYSFALQTFESSFSKLLKVPGCTCRSSSSLKTSIKGKVRV